MNELRFLKALRPAEVYSRHASSWVNDSSPSRLHAHRVESFIRRAGIPLSAPCYIGLALSASFFIFLEALHLGSVAAVTAGAVSGYLLLVFVPTELFSRRVRRMERELPEVMNQLGLRMTQGTSLDHALHFASSSISSEELRTLVHEVQQRLIFSGDVDELGDHIAELGFGVVLFGFLAAIHYASRRTTYEGATMCLEFSAVIQKEVAILQRHSSYLLSIRIISLFLLCAILGGASIGRALLIDLSSYSIGFFARELGIVVLLLSLAALLRVTSLFEWERYGRN